MTSMDTQQQDTSYNGWTNYPTWCVNLWISNDEGLYNEALDMSRETVAGDHPTSPYWTVEESRKLNLADRIEEWVNEGLLPDLDGFPSDLMRWALGQVNWHEIADSWIETAADQ